MSDGTSSRCVTGQIHLRAMRRHVARSIRRARTAFKQNRPGLTFVSRRSHVFGLESAPATLRPPARPSATRGSNEPMILRTASRSRPTMRRSVIADDRIAQRGHRHEQRRRRDSLVNILRIGARFGAALDAVDVVAHDLADRRQTLRLAGQDDPGRKPPGAAAIERVENDVDEVAHLALAGAQPHDGRFDRSGQLAHHLAHQLGLQPGRRAEMVNEIRVAHPQVRRHRLQRDGVGPVGEQQAAGGRERQRASLFRRAAHATPRALFCRAVFLPSPLLTLLSIRNF